MHVTPSIIRGLHARRSPIDFSPPDHAPFRGDTSVLRVSSHLDLCGQQS